MTTQPLPPVAPPSHECAGRGVDPSAAVRTAHDALVRAPLPLVWALMTDVEGWPRWHTAVTTLERLAGTGPLAPGSCFRWTTPIPPSELSPADTFTVTSTVGHVEHRRCLHWTGPGAGRFVHVDQGVHVWTFTEVGDATLVHTEESWTGDMVESAPELATAALVMGLQTWLSDLSTIAEQTGARA